MRRSASNSFTAGLRGFRILPFQLESFHWTSLSLDQVARRHLAASDGFGLQPAEAPKHFIAAAQASCFGRAYTEPETYHAEVKALLRLGYNTLVNVSTGAVKKTGVPFVGGAEYRPPRLDSETPEKAVRAHYGSSRASIIENYGSTDRLRVLAMSDEPGWAFPHAPDPVSAKEATGIDRHFACGQWC
jgi:hypothetical protein